MRFYPAFKSVPGWTGAVMWIGAFTILIAALMAMYANDIKKMLAFSTMSQLGYMFFAVGTDPYWGQFHLMSHAIFQDAPLLGRRFRYPRHGQQRYEQAVRRRGKNAGYRCRILGWGNRFVGSTVHERILLQRHDPRRAPCEPSVRGPLQLPASGRSSRSCIPWSAYLKVFRGEPSQAVLKAHEAPLSMEIPLAVLSILTAVFLAVYRNGDPGAHHSMPGMGIHEISPLYLVEETFGSAAFFISLVALLIGFVIVRKRSQVLGWMESHAAGLVSACRQGFYFDSSLCLA